MPLEAVPSPVILMLPTPLPAVTVLPVTSAHLATTLPTFLTSAATAVSLLPFFTQSSNQKLKLHSLLLSSSSHSLLLTFSSLAPTSLLPQSLVGLLAAAPIPLLLPTALSQRQLKTALSAWQRPPNFRLSPTIAYLTPLLIDLLSLSPSIAPSSSTAASPVWPSEWTIQPPTASVNKQLQSMVKYAVELLQLYERAHAISTEFTAFTQQRLQRLHSFNLRFLPLLPVSPHRFSLDQQLEATFPVMQLPQNHRVHIARTHEDAERSINQLIASLSGPQPLIGFDTESRPMFVAGQPNRPISLVQLSSLSMSVLCRVKVEAGLPPALVRLLVDPKVRKVGQGIGGDIKLLHAQYSGTSATADATLPDTLLSSPSSHSLVDLESLSSSYSIHRVGLASLTAAFLSLRLSKAAQLSNWERHTLTAEQVSYAALDSLVSLKLAQRLHHVQNDLQAIVRSWVDKANGRAAVAGEAVVDEQKVWRLFTGKETNRLTEMKDQTGEADMHTKQAKQLRRQQAAQRSAHGRPQQEGKEQQQPQEQKHHSNKRRRAVQPVPQSAPRSAHTAPPPGERHRAVMREGGGAAQHHSAVDSARLSDGPTVVAAQ